MLILRRKKDESILIGDDIRIRVVECKKDGARLAIDAPKSVSILREELGEAEEENRVSNSPDIKKTMQFQAYILKKKQKN